MRNTCTAGLGPPAGLTETVDTSKGLLRALQVLKDDLKYNFRFEAQRSLRKADVDPTGLCLLWLCPPLFSCIMYSGFRWVQAWMADPKP